MRIRKRKIPFPLSSLSPIPLSDPNLNIHSPAVVQLRDNPQSDLLYRQQDGGGGDDDTAAYYNHSQPSDHHPNQPIRPLRPHAAAPLQLLGDQKKALLEEGENKKVGDDDGEKSNDTRKSSSLSAEIQITGALHQQLAVSSSSSHSSHQVGSWREGENNNNNSFPIKKRSRGGFDKRPLREETSMVDKAIRNAKTKAKSKNVKKRVQEVRSNDVKEKSTVREGNKLEESKEGNNMDRKNLGASAKRKGGRGGGSSSTIMEGSRCSRVNGRGWRCCQQTLVGYSLCEHHLGKGRLRSITSVRKQSVAAKEEDHHETLSSLQPLLLSSRYKVEEMKHGVLNYVKGVDNVCEDDEKYDKKSSAIAKTKKTKLGMVKARSISSLLGQSNNGIALDEDNEVQL